MPLPEPGYTGIVAVICQKPWMGLSGPTNELHKAFLQLWRRLRPPKSESVKAWCDQELSYAAAEREVGHPQIVEIQGSRRCAERVEETLANAKTSVLIQASSITSARLVEALLAVQRRGVKVRAILGSSQGSGLHAPERLLSDEGVPIRIDEKHAMSGNKIMIVDNETILIGPLTLSNNGEETRAEDLTFLQDLKMAATYFTNLNAHEEHSVPYKVGR